MQERFKTTLSIVGTIGVIVGCTAFVKNKIDKQITVPTKHHQNFYEKYLKRKIDCSLSVGAIIVLSPLLGTVAVLIKLDMGSPIIFKQKRIGLNNEEFSLLKFRSMNDARDKNGMYLPDDERITKFGKFIRSTSLDELPSLFNIIKGDMAVIGPRPLPTRYLNRYTKKQLRRHEVRPGLSSPSTINGRNAQTWEQQFEGDVWYADHVSFLIDAKSIINTFKIVFTHEGATADDGGARGEFIGTASINDLVMDSEGNYMKLL